MVQVSPGVAVGTNQDETIKSSEATVEHSSFRSIQNSSFDLSKSDEDQDVENEVEQPDDVTITNDDVTAPPTLHDATKDLGKKQEKVKSRRGRPKKVDSSESNISSSSNDATKTKKQRGRGRPKKKEIEYKNDSDGPINETPKVAENMEDVVSDESTEERQRRRKEKLKKKRRSSIRFDPDRNETREIPHRHDQEEQSVENEENSPEQTMETTAKTLDRRGESINTTDIPEDAATIKKNADKQVTYSYRHVSTDSNS